MNDTEAITGKDVSVPVIAYVLRLALCPAHALTNLDWGMQHAAAGRGEAGQMYESRGSSA